MQLDSYIIYLWRTCTEEQKNGNVEFVLNMLFSQFVTLHLFSHLYMYLVQRVCSLHWIFIFKYLELYR